MFVQTQLKIKCRRNDLLSILLFQCLYSKDITYIYTQLKKKKKKLRVIEANIIDKSMKEKEYLKRIKINTTQIGYMHMHRTY